MRILKCIISAGLDEDLSSSSGAVVLLVTVVWIGVEDSARIASIDQSVHCHPAERMVPVSSSNIYLLSLDASDNYC